VIEKNDVLNVEHSLKVLCCVINHENGPSNQLMSWVQTSKCSPVKNICKLVTLCQLFFIRHISEWIGYYNKHEFSVSQCVTRL